MNQKTKNLLVRTIFGAIYVALMIAGIYVFPLMAVLMGLVACVSIVEFSRLTSGPVDKVSRVVLLAVAIAQFVVILYYGSQKNTFFYNAPIMTLSSFVISIPIMLLVTGLVPSVVELFRGRPIPVEHLGTSTYAYFWIVMPLAFIAVMTKVCPQVVFAFFLIIWAYDTFAYLGGSLYGRNKMCERISPKKTWEGTATGVVMAVVFAVVLPSIHYFGKLHAPLWMWVVFAFIAVLFGTLGDLLESLFKRRADVKDSGRIMPGHGGALDRFDSMLFAALPALLFALFVMVL